MIGSEWMTQTAAGAGGQVHSVVKTHRSAIVLIPDESIWEPIQRIRRQHDRQFQRWMPHVTLLYPFRPSEAFEQADSSLREVCGSLPPFALKLEAFRFFSHGPRRFTLWLEPVPRGPVAELQACLQETFTDCDDVSRYPNGFTPHLSVGQVTGRERLDDLLDRLQREWISLEMLTGAIHIIHREGDSPFRIVRSYQLGGRAKEHPSVEGQP